MKRYLLTLLCLLLLPALAEATTYYVSKSTANGYAVGNNANACTLTSAPCLTIAGGVGKMSSGDTLIINDGTYAETIDNTVPAGGGTDATRTVIKCLNARQCTIDGGLYAFNFVGSAKNWITVQDMVLCCTASVTVRHGTPGSVPSTDYPHHMRFQNNEIHTSDIYCIYTGHGQFNEYFYNYTHDCKEQHYYILARDSTFRGNYLDGIGMTQANGQGIELHTSGGMTPSNDLVEENFCRDTIHACFYVAAASNITFRRNVAWSAGFGFGALAGSTSTGTVWDHNSAYENGVGFTFDNTSTTGAVWRNNIAVGNSTNVSFCGTCGTATDNLTTGTAADIWVSPSTGDFRLKAGSAAIDGGTDIGLVYNNLPDQGAFEVPRCLSAEVGLVDATSLILTCENNVQAPLLPATGITGLTVTENAAPVTVSSCARSGDNLIDCTLGASITTGTTVLVSYTPGNITDSALIGNSYNQGMMAFSDLAVTNNVGEAPSSAVLTQKYFRWHGIYGTEAAPVVKSIGGAINAHAYSVPGGKLRLRLKVACTAADCDPLGMVLRYSLNAGGYTVVPDAFTADNIRFYGTGANADVPTSGTATTELLTSDHAINVACAITRTANAIPTVDLVQNSETECEYAIELDSDVAAGDTYDFRLYDQNGTALSAYTVTPRLTVISMQAGR